MKIAEVIVFLTGPSKSNPDKDAKNIGDRLSETEIANPMSVHAEYRPTRSLWNGMGGRTIVEVIAEDGTYGLGESAGGRASAEITAGHLKKILIRKNPFEVD